MELIQISNHSVRLHTKPWLRIQRLEILKEKSVPISYAVINYMHLFGGVGSGDLRHPKCFDDPFWGGWVLSSMEGGGSGNLQRGVDDSTDNDSSQSVKQTRTSSNHY